MSPRVGTREVSFKTRRAFLTQHTAQQNLSDVESPRSAISKSLTGPTKMIIRSAETRECIMGLFRRPGRLDRIGTACVPSRLLGFGSVAIYYSEPVRSESRDQLDDYRLIGKCMPRLRYTTAVTSKLRGGCCCWHFALLVLRHVRCLELLVLQVVGDSNCYDPSANSTASLPSIAVRHILKAYPSLSQPSSPLYYLDKTILCYSLHFDSD